MWLKNTTCSVNDIKRKVAGEKFKMSVEGEQRTEKNKVYMYERCDVREQRKKKGKVHVYQAQMWQMWQMWQTLPLMDSVILPNLITRTILINRNNRKDLIKRMERSCVRILFWL